MAIKTSNQIIFTEEKKVLDIIEWYLISDQPEGINIDKNASKEVLESNGWSTQVMSTTEEKPYLWNCEQVKYSIGLPEVSTPAIIRTYGKVSDIVNYYMVTSTANTPAVPDDFSGWTDDFSKITMSSTNKYLWNLEVIMYADGTTNFSKPTIAGVYGDSAVVLKIYSLDGFEFSDSAEEYDRIENITLQAYALRGTEPITDATFTWSYHTPNIENNIETLEENGDIDLWTNIEGYINVGDPTLVVNIEDIHAFSTLRCEMVLPESETPIYDYITLTQKTDIYTAVIKFFDGNNIFAYGQEHIVGYVEVYKNNKVIESHAGSMVYNCTGIDENTGNITTDYIHPVDENDPTYNVKQVYFMYHEDATDTTKERCNIILGTYDEKEQVWKVTEPQSQYIYATTDDDNDVSMTAGIFVVSKNNITRSKDVNIGVYTKYLEPEDGSDETTLTPDSKSLLVSTSTTLIDLNDTIVGPESSVPKDPYDGQMWFNTDEDVLMVYKVDESGETGTWVYSSAQQAGKTVHVSKPSSYKKGDLWIVEDDMTVNSYIVTQVTNTTSGEYYIFENDQYIAKTLPSDYKEGVKYYSKFTYSSGATLKATTTSNEYNANHWIAVNPTLAHVQDGVTQFFKFDPTNGLRIGRIDQSFYVNLDSTEMGFYVNNQQEVHIGTNDTRIKDLTVEKRADFNCEITLDDKINIINTNTNNNTTYPGFAWQIEPDGGFSLVKMEV